MPEQSVCVDKHFFIIFHHNLAKTCEKHGKGDFHHRLELQHPNSGRNMQVSTIILSWLTLWTCEWAFWPLISVQVPFWGLPYSGWFLSMGCVTSRVKFCLVIESSNSCIRCLMSSLCPRRFSGPFNEFKLEIKRRFRTKLARAKVQKWISQKNF